MQAFCGVKLTGLSRGAVTRCCRSMALSATAGMFQNDIAFTCFRVYHNRRRSGPRSDGVVLTAAARNSAHNRICVPAGRLCDTLIFEKKTGYESAESRML